MLYIWLISTVIIFILMIGCVKLLDGEVTYRDLLLCFIFSIVPLLNLLIMLIIILSLVNKLIDGKIEWLNKKVF